MQVVTKKRPKLAKRFKCPFCSNDDTVECKMDFKAGIGTLNCRLCGAAYQMPIHHLHEPIDVFSEWLDDCEAAQNPTAANATDNYDDDNNNDDEDNDDLPASSGLHQQSRKPKAKDDRNARSIDLGDVDSEDDDDDDE